MALLPPDDRMVCPFTLAALERESQLPPAGKMATINLRTRLDAEMRIPPAAAPVIWDEEDVTWIKFLKDHDL
ncbi:hypothetical protein HDU96_003771, partial [Phlyctochytrium bullatum]